jgi:CBS domain-containing protein
VSNELYQRRVKDVMSKHVVTITAKDTVHDALESMMENKVSTLPVIDQAGHCVGILSTSDFVDVSHDLEAGLNDIEHESELWWSLYVRNLSQKAGHRNVMELMTEDVIATGPEALLVRAAETMLRERIHRLPVLDDEQRLLGILSTTDVLRAFVDASPEKKTVKK